MFTRRILQSSFLKRTFAKNEGDKPKKSFLFMKKKQSETNNHSVAEEEKINKAPKKLLFSKSTDDR